MTNRDNVAKTYLTDEEMAQLSKWADDAGKTKSDLLRDAVLEYLDHDRAARIEEQVRDNGEKIDRLLRQVADDTTHTHKGAAGSKRSTSATEKVRQITDRILSNHGEVIKADDVERAIEDYAGADNRTLRKYKRLLRKRGLLFEHPSDKRPLWTSETDQWTRWIENYGKTAGADAVEDYLDNYPATASRTADGISLDLSEIKQ